MLAAPDYEAEYDNRARVPEYPAIFARWNKSAAEYRAAHHNAELGLRYGPNPRQTIDLFWPSAGRDAPMVVFIHGGYWRSLEPSMFSHAAAGGQAHGFAVAMPGYSLCPGASISGIIGEMQEAFAFLWHRHRRKLFACGHSAGGHLAACMFATDWEKRGLPAGLVPAGFSLGGIFDLLPLLGVSMNADIKLTAGDARMLSPLNWDLPEAARAFDAWAGSRESGEFKRQSRALADTWSGGGVSAHYREIDGDHFTIVDPLADPGSETTKRLVELAKSIG